MISSDTVVEQAKKYSPLVASWWVVLIQGLVIGALGIYLVSQPDVAKTSVGRALALYLYSVGLVDLARNRLLPEAPGKKVGFLRALVAAIVGGICVLLLVFEFSFTTSIAQTVVWLLGAGMLLYGIAGLYLAFTVRQRGSGRLLSTIASVIFIALGFGVVFLEGRNVVEGWIGPVLIVLGVGLIGFAIYRFRQTRQAADDAVAEASTAAAGAVATAPATSTAGSTAPVTATATDTATAAAITAATTSVAEPTTPVSTGSAPSVDAPASAPSASSTDAAGASTSSDAGQNGA